MSKETFAVGNFCRDRQLGEAGRKAPLSHTILSESMLALHTAYAYEKGYWCPGYRDGVILVSLHAVRDIFTVHSAFFSAVTDLKEGDELCGKFESRQEGEEPRQSVFVKRPEKSPAQAVYIVCYRKDVLAETNDGTTDADWEIVSINCYDKDYKYDPPIAPMTLLHNHFGSDGGTTTKMTAEELEKALRESMEFWKNKALILPELLEIA